MHVYHVDASLLREMYLSRSGANGAKQGRTDTCADWYPNWYQLVQRRKCDQRPATGRLVCSVISERRPSRRPCPSFRYVQSGGEADLYPRPMASQHDPGLNSVKAIDPCCGLGLTSGTTPTPSPMNIGATVTMTESTRGDPSLLDGAWRKDDNMRDPPSIITLPRPREERIGGRAVGGIRPAQRSDRIGSVSVQFSQSERMTGLLDLPGDLNPIRPYPTQPNPTQPDPHCTHHSHLAVSVPPSLRLSPPAPAVVWVRYPHTQSTVDGPQRDRGRRDHCDHRDRRGSRGSCSIPRGCVRRVGNGVGGRG